MKPTLFIYTFILIVICLYSCQTKQSDAQPGFDGICGFVLGRTTTSSLDSFPYNFREINVKEDIEDVITGGEYVRHMDWRILCEGIRMFISKDFHKDEFNLPDMTLTFYNDTLCVIECHGSQEFEEMLKLKYPDYTFNDTSSTAFHTHDWDYDQIKATSQHNTVLDLNTYNFRIYSRGRQYKYGWDILTSEKKEYLKKMNFDYNR